MNGTAQHPETSVHLSPQPICHAEEIRPVGGPYCGAQLFASLDREFYEMPNDQMVADTFVDDGGVREGPFVHVRVPEVRVHGYYRDRHQGKSVLLHAGIRRAS
jgi:hypothetical protein